MLDKESRRGYLEYFGVPGPCLEKPGGRMKIRTVSRLTRDSLKLRPKPNKEKQEPKGKDSKTRKLKT